MAIPFIEFCGVSFSAGGRAIVDDVHWEIRRAEHWAVLGANGAGKTTLMRLLCGMQWPNTGGRILRLGQELQDLRQLQRGIGWVGNTLVAQVPRREPVLKLVASGRVAEIGLRPPIATDASPDELAMAERLLDGLGILALAARLFVTLSQGEQQKVLLARALMAEPLLMILDEPCVGLDPGAREDFLHLLQSQLDVPGAATVILVTHHVEEIVPGIDHTLVMQDGRIIGQGRTQEVITPELIARTYHCTPPALKYHAGRVWPRW